MALFTFDSIAGELYVVCNFLSYEREVYTLSEGGNRTLEGAIVVVLELDSSPIAKTATTSTLLMLLANGRTAAETGSVLLELRPYQVTQADRSFDDEPPHVCSIYFIETHKIEGKVIRWPTESTDC